MATETTFVCEHGISALTLSTWRDGDMPEAEAAAISAHVASCAASRRHLADYDAIAAALRSQPVPVAGERLWRGLEARMSTPGERPQHLLHMRRGRASRVGRLAGTLAALAAAILIVAGFVRVLAAQNHSRPPTTAHPLPALKLTWARATPPPGMQSYGFSQVYVASSNGNIAYGCVSPLDVSGKTVPGVPDGTTTVWVTRDRAAHWLPAGILPLVRHDITLCAVIADNLDPTHLVAIATWQRQPGFNFDARQSLAFISTNSGTTWHTLTNPQDTQIIDFVTYGATTYALFNNYTGSASPQHVLYASDDDMRTWHAIDAQINTAGGNAGQFWARPDSGALLLESFDLNPPPGKNVTHLWTSDDGGAHWTQISGVPDASGFAVLAQAGKPWTICGTNFEKTTNPNWPGALWCSTDGGRTWAQRPLPPGDVPAGSQPSDGSFFGAQVAGIADSGDIIAQVGLSANRGDTLYRLVPGHSQWQSLGSAPSPYVTAFYIPDAGHGVLWATSGVVNPDQTGPTPPVQIFTATYPPEP